MLISSGIGFKMRMSKFGGVIMINSFDLHMHSGYSADGQFTPKELIAIAKEKGLTTIALTDHDLVKGVKEITEIGKINGIDVIPGIECSTLYGDYDVHLLGYGIDIEDEYFVNLHKKIQKLSTAAFYARVEKIMAKYPVKIDLKKLVKEANGKNPWFKMWMDIFSNPEYQQIEDFKPYIPGGDRSDPAPVNFFWDKCQPGSDLYVRVEMPSLKDSIKEIHRAGGVAVLAHPFRTFYQKDKDLEKIISWGLDGMEIYSNYHSPEHIDYYLDFAKRHNLLITCGSDFHGKNKPSIKMGEYGLNEDGSIYLDHLKKALK